MLALLFLALNVYPIVWMCHGLFIRSATEGQLGCFQVLTSSNKAIAINVYVQVVCT